MLHTRDPAHAASFTDDQSRAFVHALDWLDSSPSGQVFVVDGGAGTGKTSLSVAIANRTRSAVMAPTGKAAQVLRDAGRADARTIHRRLFRHRPEPAAPGGFVARFRPDSGVRRARVLVVDEGSMVSRQLADPILALGKPVIVFRDTYQLPPVDGDPAFTEPDDGDRLDAIVRQKAGHPIIELSQRIRENRHDAFEPTDSGPLTVAAPTDANIDRHLADCDQAIAGRRATVRKLNYRIRFRRGIHDVLPRSDERLVCTKNRLDLFNGSICIARSDARPCADGIAAVRLQRARNARPAPYRILTRPFDGVDPRPGDPAAADAVHVELGDVLTAHRAQGSQWQRVVVLDESHLWPPEEALRWLYTAVTRASESLVLLTPRLA